MTSCGSIDLRVDVTEAAGLGEPAHIALTVTAPDELPTEPVVCFAKPGAGYSRGYYTEDLPGPAGPAPQAAWHAGAAGSSSPSTTSAWATARCTIPNGCPSRRSSAASEAAEAEVRQKLAAGTLIDGLGPVARPLTIGIGQSMGGAFTIVQQGRHHGYDGVGVLGYSPLRTQPPTGAGHAAARAALGAARHALSDGVFTNGPALAERRGAEGARPSADAPWHGGSTTTTSTRRSCGATWRTIRPGTATSRRGGRPPSPRTAVLWCLAPGSILAEAAAIRCPCPRCAGRARRARRPAGRAARLRVVAQRRLLRLPAHGAHAQLRGTRELFWQRIRDVGRMGTGDAVSGLPGCAAGTRLDRRPELVRARRSPARSPSPSSWRMIRTAVTPSEPATQLRIGAERADLARARNMTCDETACTRSVPAASATPRSKAAVSKRTNCGPRCSAASGEATSDDSTGSAQ